MRSDVYGRLRPALQSLASQIEETTGITIEVRETAARPSDSWIAEAVGVNELGVVLGAGRIAIETPSAINDVDEAGIAHELLHVKRAFLERVPHPYPKHKGNGPFAASLDNWLEHTFIYGPQMAFVPEMRTGWNQGIVDFWTEGVHEAKDELSLKFNLLTRAMCTTLYASGDAKSLMRASIDHHFRRYAVGATVNSAIRIMSDKTALLRLALSYLAVDRRLFWLRRFGWRERENEWWDMDSPNAVTRG